MLQVARAPGRVNLIGDHTDYTGGLVLPMAINRHTTIVFERSKDVSAISSNFAGEVRFGLPVIDVQAVQPAWGRYIAGVAAAMSERQAKAQPCLRPLMIPGKAAGKITFVQRCQPREPIVIAARR